MHKINLLPLLLVVLPGPMATVPPTRTADDFNHVLLLFNWSAILSRKGVNNSFVKKFNFLGDGNLLSMSTAFYAGLIMWYPDLITYVD